MPFYEALRLVVALPVVLLAAGLALAGALVLDVDDGEPQQLAARSLRTLSDDELIAQAPARTSLSRPHHEMEMQRRLKDSIEANTKETRLLRRSSDRWSLIIAVLTAAIVALAIVLALKA